VKGIDSIILEMNSFCLLQDRIRLIESLRGINRTVSFTEQCVTNIFSEKDVEVGIFECSFFPVLLCPLVIESYVYSSTAINNQLIK
jgi:hypothetical protein